MSLVLTLVIEVVDSVAVCEDDTVVTPLAAEDVNEKTEMLCLPSHKAQKFLVVENTGNRFWLYSQ